MSDIESEEGLSDINKNLELCHSIKNWALLKILNMRLNNVLPKDARTLLDTKKENLNISVSAPVHYWHNGLVKCLKKKCDNVSSLLNEIFPNI